MNLENIIIQKKQPLPYILLTEDINDPDQAFLGIDCSIIGEVKIESIPFVLLSAYFIFNICYIKGCNNFFNYLEALLLDGNREKMTGSVRLFIIALHNYT